MNLPVNRTLVWSYAVRGALWGHNFTVPSRNLLHRPLLLTCQLFLFLWSDLFVIFSMVPWGPKYSLAAQVSRFFLPVTSSCNWVTEIPSDQSLLPGQRPQPASQLLLLPQPSIFPATAQMHFLKYKSDPITLLFKTFHWLSTLCKRKPGLLTMAHQSLHGTVPVHCSERISPLTRPLFLCLRTFLQFSRQTKRVPLGLTLLLPWTGLPFLLMVPRVEIHF